MTTMTRRIPVTMATQHPDSARKYISVQKEVDEAIRAFTEGLEDGLNYDEYKIDYEGKLTPYHQPSQIVTRLLSLGLIPGKDVFVTPRMPSAREETVFRQLMAMMAVIEANYNVQDQIDSPAIIEIINPMTRNASDLIEAKRRVNDLISLANESLGSRLKSGDLEVIPLFEHVPTLININEIMRSYFSELKERSYFRVFLGRSDPALFCGLISATLAVKLAICKLHRLSNEIGIPIYPILGVGSLPFRGHLTPGNVQNVIAEYSGCRTITIQSALRYDYPKSRVRDTIRYIKESLPKSSVRLFTQQEENTLVEIIQMATESYRSFLSPISWIVEKISEYIPNQRDRLLPSAGLNYIRHDETIPGSGIPRVIKATASLYSIGLPPEILGLGSTIEKLSNQQIRLLNEIYPSMICDIRTAARYVNLNIARKFIGQEISNAIEKDFKKAMELLHIEVEQDEQYQAFLTLLEQCLRALMSTPNSRSLREARALISKTGFLRGGLG